MLRQAPPVVPLMTPVRQAVHPKHRFRNLLVTLPLKKTRRALRAIPVAVDAAVDAIGKKTGRKARSLGKANSSRWRVCLTCETRVTDS
jgi:hypothetical protein